MLVKRQGIAPLVIVLLIALGLTGGTTAGYVFREPIKKAIEGKTTVEEIKEAVQTETAKLSLGQSKFELEGVVTAINTVVPAGTTASTTSNTLTVKIKSSTNSIKQLRLSETPIIVGATAKINAGGKDGAAFADILIGSQVHIGGTIASDGKLTATKIIVQKDEANEQKADTFSVSGKVKSVATDSIVVSVSHANKKAADQKGKDLTVKVSATTIIEKGEATIALAEVKADDEVQVTGVVAKDEYTASRIKVKIREQAGELEEEQEVNRGGSTNLKNTNQNKNSNSGNLTDSNETTNGSGSDNSSNGNGNANSKKN